MRRRERSWIDIGIYVIWAVTAVVFFGFLYVAIHFIRKFW